MAIEMLLDWSANQDGPTPGSIPSDVGQSLLAQRIAGAQKILDLLDSWPAVDPPDNLAQATVDLIDAVDMSQKNTAICDQSNDDPSTNRAGGSID